MLLKLQSQMKLKENIAIDKIDNQTLVEYDLLLEILNKFSIREVLQKLSIHNGTIKRWFSEKKVPSNYYNDLNFLLNNKYPERSNFRAKDQFFTTKAISNYCYKKTLEILQKLEIEYKDHIFIEPSAGCCNFFEILPSNKRIGIDIEPIGALKNELITENYLNFFPPENGKYIVIGNPPFGLRGNLALRFINHSSAFADVVAFILPPLFDSTGKGVPMKRVKDYKLAYSEKLPINSFQYPNGEEVNIATIFQIWTKINIDKIESKALRSCKDFIKVYSLSDGGTPSSTRNKKMIEKCDVYLPSTCFSGMKAYSEFCQLPNKRGYGVVFLKDKAILKEIFYNKINWQEEAFLSTNSAINLRTDLIEMALIKHGIYDK